MTDDRPAATSATHADDPDARTPDVLRRAAERAIDYRSSLPDRRVGATPGLAVDDLRQALGGPLPRHGTDPLTVIDDLADGVEPGLVAMSGPRYFGFVIGGSHPAALAADWLTSAWDQNAVLYLASPAAAVVEEVAAAWLVELLGLPADTSVGFTTSATLANFAGLAAARHAVLRRVGWDVEEDGLRRRTADPGHRRCRRPRVAAARAALRRARPWSSRADPDRRRGPHGRRRAGRRAARRHGADHRLRAARRGEHRRVRSDRARRRGGARPPERVAPRRRRLRPVGRRQPPPATPGRRVRRCRLVGDRRPQVAQRAVRQRPRRSFATVRRIEPP